MFFQFPYLVLSTHYHRCGLAPSDIVTRSPGPSYIRGICRRLSCRGFAPWGVRCSFALRESGGSCACSTAHLYHLRWKCWKPIVPTDLMVSFTRQNYQLNSKNWIRLRVIRLNIRKIWPTNFFFYFINFISVLKISLLWDENK